MHITGNDQLLLWNSLQTIVEIAKISIFIHLILRLGNLERVVISVHLLFRI